MHCNQNIWSRGNYGIINDRFKMKGQEASSWLNMVTRKMKIVTRILPIYVAIHDARRLIHVCCFSSLMLCLCCMLRESYTSRCDTITICMQQQRSCMLVLRAAQHKHKEREGLEYNRRAVFENRRESLHICIVYTK